MSRDHANEFHRDKSNNTRSAVSMHTSILVLTNFELPCGLSIQLWPAEDTPHHATVQIQLHHAMVFVLHNALATVIPGSCN